MTEVYKYLKGFFPNNMNEILILRKFVNFHHFETEYLLS